MKLVQVSATEAEKYISGRMTVSVHQRESRLSSAGGHEKAPRSLLLVNEGQVFDSSVLSGKKQVWGFMMSSFMITTGSQLRGANSQVCNSNNVLQ